MKKALNTFVKGSGRSGNAPKADQVMGTSLKKFCQNLAFHGGYAHDDHEFLFIVKSVFNVTFIKKGESTKTVKKVDSVKQWIGHVTRSADDIACGVKKDDSFCRDNGTPRVVGQDAHTILPPALDKAVDDAQDKYRAKK